MNPGDRARTLTAVKALSDTRLELTWSDGAQAVVDLATLLDKQPRVGGRRLQASEAQIGEWGHSLAWPGGFELGADTLWLETLTMTGHADARAFLEWRLRHGLSLTKAADALGLSRRTIAYYSNGDRPVPRAILLACRGWELGEQAA
jgi:hypothetical protein